MQTAISEAGMNFLQTLRTETGVMHKQLEQNPLSSALMHPSVTSLQYARYLSYMRNVIAWSEEHIFPLVENILPITARYKLRSIDNDLDKLTTPAHTVPFKPICEISNPAAALGAMYVIEGSTLGGKVILKHLNSKLQLDENTGAAFFYGYGAETGKQWNTFLETFTRYITDIHGENAAIEAAKCTFSSIDNYFE